MPFTSRPNPIVSQYTRQTAPNKNPGELNSLPNESSFLKLIGGNGGGLGEKSFKPQVFLSQADFTDGSSNLDFTAIDKNFFSFNEIKSENDAGYAIRFANSASCTLNLGAYSEFPQLNIYQKSNLFSYDYLYSGITNSNSPISNGGSYGDFALECENIASVTPVQDTSLNLNKYYVDLRPVGYSNNSDVPFTTYVQLKRNLTNLNSLQNLFMFHVVDFDILDVFAPYLTSNGLTYTKGSTEVIISNISSNGFAIDDRIKIEHPEGYFGIAGIITNTSPFTIKGEANAEYKIKEINLPNSNPIIFPAGSTVSVLEQNTINNDPFVPTQEQKAIFSSFSNGLNFVLSVDKKRSLGAGAVEKEIFNNLYFKSNSYRDGFKSLIDQGFERIGSRKYVQDQYGSDANKLAIKNKSKFGIVYHGCTINDNSTFTFRCGLNHNEIYTETFQSTSPFASDSLDYVIANGIPNQALGGNHMYYSNKIYEVLVYKDLNFNLGVDPVDLIISSLINKYKNRAFFSSVEFQNSDMYYTSADRINILGKVTKS